MKLLGSLVLVLTLSSFALAGKVPSAWKARYKAEVKLIIARDFKAYSALVADDYVWVKPDGTKVDRKTAMAEYEPLFGAKKVTGDSVPQKVVVHGDLVDVTFKAKFTFEFDGQPTLKFYEVGVDTWKKIKGKWQIVKTVDKVVATKEIK